MKALERGHVCEERALSGKGSAKYGTMLSSLFEKSWEKNHLSALKSWDIFIFTLSWRPFVQFLDRFCKYMYNEEFKKVFIGITMKYNSEVTRGIVAPHSLYNVQH